MPKASNPEIEKRILKSAMKLWNRGGENAVSMRKVATEARTSTPTIYERFPNKRGLMIAIREQSLVGLLDFLEQAESSTAFFSRYIDFGERNPKHYELLFGSGWKDRRNPESMPPVVSRLQAILAKESGLKLESLKGTAFAIWSLLHGTVMLRIVVKKPGRNWPLVKDVCLKSCEILKVSNFEAKRVQK